MEAILVTLMQLFMLLLAGSIVVWIGQRVQAWRWRHQARIQRQNIVRMSARRRMPPDQDAA
jgi:hypothetical protein